MPFFNRFIGNPLLTGLTNFFYGCRLTDTQTGMRAFTRKIYNTMNLKTSGMEFASEMVIKATLADMKISQTPITLRPDGRSRPPHLRSWRDGWRHLRLMLLYSSDWLFILPSLLLALVGLSGFVILLLRSSIITEIIFDLNSLIVRHD